MRTESRPHVRGCGNTLAVSTQTQWLPLNNLSYMTCSLTLPTVQRWRCGQSMQYISHGCFVNTSACKFSSMELGPCKPTSLLGSSFGQVKSHAPPREWLRFTEHEKDIPAFLCMLYTSPLSYLFVRHGFLVVRLAVAALPFILLWCCRIVFWKDPTVCRRHHDTIWWTKH